MFLFSGRLSLRNILDSTIAKVNCRLVTFAKVRKFMDKMTSSLVYKQTILPYFDYISLITESCIKRKIKKLQPLQNKAVKIIMGRNNYVSTEDMMLLHKELKLEMLSTRRKRFMLNFVFKYSKDIQNVNITIGQVGK